MISKGSFISLLQLYQDNSVMEPGWKALGRLHRVTTHMLNCTVRPLQSFFSAKKPQPSPNDGGAILSPPPSIK